MIDPYHLERLARALARAEKAEAELAQARAALKHVRSSAQTGTYDGGVVISFAALVSVRTALSADKGASRE